MDTIVTISEQFLNHRKRGLIVIIATSVISLLVLWPSVDTFFRLRARSAEAQTALQDAEAAAATAVEREGFAQEVTQRLSAVEAKTYAEDDVHLFRGQLTDLVRQAGCQLRRVEVSAASRRKWMSKDDPLGTLPPTKDVEPTPFKLRTQVVSLSVTGDLPSLRKLMEEVHKLDKLMHTQRFQIRSAAPPGMEGRSGESSKLLGLELELMLIGLESDSKAA